MKENLRPSLRSVEASEKASGPYKYKLSDDRDYVLRQIRLIANKTGKDFGEAANFLFEENKKHLTESELETLARIIGGLVSAQEEMLVSVLRSSRSGVLRTTVTRRAVGGYGTSDAAGNLTTVNYDLLRIYQAMAESQDRTQIAVNYTERSYDKSGVAGFMDSLDHLQTSEEKAKALRNLLSRIRMDYRNSGRMISEEEARNLESRTKELGLELGSELWKNTTIKK